jgi:hypothetical protein
MAVTVLPTDTRKSFMNPVLTSVGTSLNVVYVRNSKLCNVSRFKVLTTGKGEDLLGGSFELVISNYKSCCNLLMSVTPDEYVYWHLVFVY